MSLCDQLFDQILGDPPDAGSVPTTVPSGLLNTLVIDDRRLAALDRGADEPVAVTVINTSGAGGITALAGRSLTQCRPVAVQNVVRDAGDLVGNIARIAAASRELDPDVTILVDIPDGFGWPDAVAAAEAEGLTAVTGRAAPDQLAARLSAFIEADLPFVIDDVESAVDLVAVLTAVDSLIDEADIPAAATLLAGADHDQQLIAIKGWDDNRTGRVRRRLRAVRTHELARMTAELAEAELI